MLIHLLVVSLCSKDKWFIVFQSESDKRERSISTLGLEVAGNKGECEEGVGIGFDPGTSWVEVVICGAGFLLGERTQRVALVDEVWEVFDFLGCEGRKMV